MTWLHCRPAKAVEQLLEAPEKGSQGCASPGRFAFPADGMTYRLASKATPATADRCPAALDSSESLALQLLI